MRKLLVIFLVALSGSRWLNHVVVLFSMVHSPLMDSSIPFLVWDTSVLDAPIFSMGVCVPVVVCIFAPFSVCLASELMDSESIVDVSEFSGINTRSTVHDYTCIVGDRFIKFIASWNMHEFMDGNAKGCFTIIFGELVTSLSDFIKEALTLCGFANHLSTVTSSASHECIGGGGK